MSAQVADDWRLERADGGGFGDKLVSPDGLTVYSPAKRRYYQRQFNHDEARRLSKQGVPTQQIARRLGVSNNAITYVLRPKTRLRMIQNADKRAHTTCDTCGERTLVGNHPNRHVGDGRAICRRCRSKERRVRVRVSEDGQVVIRCHGCQQWRPGADFTHGVYYPRPAPWRLPLVLLRLPGESPPRLPSGSQGAVRRRLRHPGRGERPRQHEL